MKILVIDKSALSGCLNDLDFSLFKHLEFWRLGNNNIDLLAKVSKDIKGKLESKIKIVRFPLNIPLINVLFLNIFVFLKSRKYDLIVQVWHKFPNYPLILTKKSFVAIFGNEFRILIPRKVFYFLYSKTKFLVNSNLVRDKLLKFGIKSGNVKFIPDGIKNGQEIFFSKKDNKKKNKIVVVSKKDFKSAVQLISLVERRSLEWKFVVLIEKNKIKKLKNLLNKSEIDSDVKIVTLTDHSYFLNIKDAKFVVLFKDLRETIDYIYKALSFKTQVIVENHEEEIKDFISKSLVFSFDNHLEMADKIVSLAKNESDYVKYQEKISKFVKVYSWDEVGELSREYIEAL